MAGKDPVTVGELPVTMVRSTEKTTAINTPIVSRGM